ncbi:PhzF family phenazine biosynthesis protein [Pseudomonas sp. PvP001]|uniref:PhzF family phenazine biosynthesis protein n=1 Tax=Pseudomonas sp. PvP001 TaxID=3158559 RepID=UPI003399D1EF
MHRLAFKQVDVFTTQRFKGNPLAVVLQAESLTREQMQQIAHWNNLSETAFVLPATRSDADYRLRIFTPNCELPFAGHATIGSAHALIEAGLIEPRNGKLVQECYAGLIDVDIARGSDGSQLITFELPPATIQPVNDSDHRELQAVLGVSVVRDRRPCFVTVGPRWLVVQLRDAQTVLAVIPDLARMAINDHRTSTTGVVIFGPHPEGSNEHIEVRTFAPTCGITEDAACGSGSGAVAAFIRATGQTTSLGSQLRVAQGAALGRAGKLHLSITDQSIKVTGACVTCLDGSLDP